MTADQFGPWSIRSKQGFIDQQIASGTAEPCEARGYAERQFAQLLPDGLATVGHHVWSVFDDQREIGYVWLWIRAESARREAFLLDIQLDEAIRGNGFGTAAMRATEAAARDLRAHRMRLNVFGHNTVARGLYASLGYTVVDTLLVPGAEHSAGSPEGTQVAAELLEKLL